jgi:hypothetical protein
VPGRSGSQTHLFQLYEPSLQVVFLGSGKRGCADWVSVDCEVVRILTAASQNDSIQAGEPELLNLSALCLKGVEFGAIPQFFRRQFFCMPANPGLDECTGKTERGPAIIKAAKCNMNVRVLSVVVDDRHPFQLCKEAPFDATHQIASVLFKIHPLTKFWRDDDLEHPLIACGLPRC